MSLTARTPPVGAISDVEKVACLVVCAVTAVPPDDYAARFEEFLLQEVLGVDAPAPRARTWSPFW